MDIAKREWKFRCNLLHWISLFFNFFYFPLWIIPSYKLQIINCFSSILRYQYRARQDNRLTCNFAKYEQISAITIYLNHARGPWQKSRNTFSDQLLPFLAERYLCYSLEIRHEIDGIFSKCSSFRIMFAQICEMSDVRPVQSRNSITSASRFSALIFLEIVFYLCA